MTQTESMTPDTKKLLLRAIRSRIKDKVSQKHVALQRFQIEVRRPVPLAEGPAARIVIDPVEFIEVMGLVCQVLGASPRRATKIAKDTLRKAHDCDRNYACAKGLPDE